MYPVFDEEVKGTYDTPEAPVYINNGCGGAHATPTSYCDFDYDWMEKQPEWSAARLTLPGYARIEYGFYQTT